MKAIILSLFLSYLIGCSKTASVDPEPPCQPNAKADCACTQVYDPVCGCDGITYSNACFATCAGVNYVKGACAGK